MGKDLVKENCPLCESLFEPNQKYGQSIFCHHCVTLYTPYWDYDLYDESYKDKYIAHWESETNDPIQSTRWETVQQHIKSGSLLDIGCGTGSFLRAAPRSFDCVGCDINQHCVDYCNENGIEASERMPLDHKFDVVTMFDVIEHYPNFEIIYDIKCILKDNGYFIFCTPNFKPEFLRNLEDWRHYRPAGEHVFCFSEKSILTLAKIHNFEVVDINFEESKIRLPEQNIATYVLKKG